MLREFFAPFAALRSQLSGGAVSLIKEGVRLRGFDVGLVRPPLIDPSPDQSKILRELLATGDRIVAEFAEPA